MNLTKNRFGNMTKTAQVSQHLMQTITTLRAEGQKKLPTESELSELLGTSIVTIRRAMKEFVDNGTVRRVAGKGTFIEDRRSEDVINTGRMPVIGFMHDIMGLSEYAFCIIRSVAKAAHAKGLDLAVCQIGSLNLINTWLPSVSGPAEVVGFMGYKLTSEMIKTLDSKNIPYVALSELSYRTTAKWAVIGIKEYACGFDYLCKLGHRRICCLEAYWLSHLLDEVRNGVNFCKNFGYEVTTILKESFANWEKTIEQIDDILNMPENQRPTAFICHDDTVAAWVISYLQSKGFKVPDDFSVIGIGNFNIGLSLLPRITTIAMPYDEMGEQAVDLFLKQLSKKQVQNPIREINYRVIERDSCSTTPII